MPTMEARRRLEGCPRTSRTPRTKAPASPSPLKWREAPVVRVVREVRGCNFFSGRQSPRELQVLDERGEGRGLGLLVGHTQDERGVVGGDALGLVGELVGAAA